MFCHVGQTLDAGLHPLLMHVLADGVPVGSRRSASASGLRDGGATAIQIARPRARISATSARGKIVGGALGEFLWYMSGSRSGDQIAYYLPAYKKEFQRDRTVYGAYGPRILDWNGYDQFQGVVDSLKENPDTKRAVIQIFDGSDLAIERIEVPCTLSMQFRSLNDAVNCVVYMRSNDVWKGFPHDLFCFTLLHELVAVATGLRLGTYTQIAGSSHLYEDDVSKAQRYVDEASNVVSISMPPMPNAWEEGLGFLLEAEDKIRTGESVNPDSARISNYWKDLCFLLLLHRAHVTRDVVLWRRVQARLDQTVYRHYAKLKTLPANDQMSLGLTGT